MDEGQIRKVVEVFLASKHYMGRDETGHRLELWADHIEASKDGLLKGAIVQKRMREFALLTIQYRKAIETGEGGEQYLPDLFKMAADYMAGKRPTSGRKLSSSSLVASMVVEHFRHAGMQGEQYDDDLNKILAVLKEKYPWLAQKNGEPCTVASLKAWGKTRKIDRTKEKKEEAYPDEIIADPLALYAIFDFIDAATSSLLKK